MAASGRFGKYGDLKRKQKIRALKSVSGRGRQSLPAVLTPSGGRGTPAAAQPPPTVQPREKPGTRNLRRQSPVEEGRE